MAHVSSPVVGWMLTDWSAASNVIAPGGSVCVSTTPVAASVPLLVTVME